MKTRSCLSAFIGVHRRPIPFLDSKLNLAKFVKAFFAYNPLSGFQRAPGEAFPAARGVAQRDGVRPAIEANFVSTGNRAGAICAHVDGARIARLLHLFHQLQQGTRWRVFLRRVMDFPGPCAVCRLGRQQPRGFRHQAEEDVHADRKIGTPHQAGMVHLDRPLHPIDVFQPAGGAYHQRTPGAAMPSTLPGTAAGMENSMATSTPAKFPAVRPAPPGLLNSSSLSATSKSYSGASCSMSLPIFP